jgi:hypothetical protein
MAIGMKAYVWGKRLERKEIKYPANWKEAFKERWFPKWMLERYPVRYTVFIVDAKILYPNFVYHIPENNIELRDRRIKLDLWQSQ